MIWLDKIHTSNGNNLIGLWNHPQTPFRVIKGVSKRDAFLQYAFFLLRKQPKNPHFPRVFDIWIEGDIAYIEMERLRDMTYDEQDDYRNLVYASEAYITPHRDRHNDVKDMAPHEFLCALRLIRRHFIDRLKHMSDLHECNLLVRPSTNAVVINDPIWG